MVRYDNAYSDLAKATHCKAFPDLYSARARRLIGQLCREFLDSAHMTPTELVYSRPHQKALLDKGMFLRNAIQQAATAQVSGTGRTVHDRIRELYELIDQGVKMTARISDSYQCPEFTADRFGEVAATIRADNDSGKAVFHIYRTLATYLADVDDWRAKFERLIALFDGKPSAEDIKLLDTLLAEMLSSGAAVRELFGEAERLYDRMIDFIDLYHGCYPTDQDSPSATAVEVNKVLANNDLPKTRAALSALLLQLLAGSTPLVNGPAVKEIGATRRLFHKMRDSDKPVGGDRLLELVEKRMARHLNHDQIARMLPGKTGPAKQIKFLLGLYDLVMGNDNRTFVFGKLKFIVENPRFEEELLGGSQVIGRLKEIGRLDRCFRGSEMKDKRLEWFTDRLADMESRLLRTHSVFARLGKTGRDAAHKAVNLIELCEAEAFTEGENQDNARKLIRYYLGQPDFKAALFAGADTELERESRVENLKTRLRGVGMDLAAVGLAGDGLRGEANSGIRAP